MKKNEKIIILIVLLFAIGLYFGVQYVNKSKDIVVVYRANGEVLKEFPLNEDGEYDFDGDYGNFHLVVKDGSVRAVDVDCPNKICETMGIDKDSSIMNCIVCIPNAIYVQLKDNYESN